MTTELFRLAKKVNPYDLVPQNVSRLAFPLVQYDDHYPLNNNDTRLKCSLYEIVVKIYRKRETILGKRKFTFR